MNVQGTKADPGVLPRAMNTLFQVSPGTSICLVHVVLVLLTLLRSQM